MATRPTPPIRSEARSSVRAFGTYIRMIRENLHGKGRGMSLRRLARASGIPASVLSRGERGIQDLRKPEHIERLAPALGVKPSVMKRVAALITAEDVEYFRAISRNYGPGALDPRGDGARMMLWTRLSREVGRLRGAQTDTLEALLSYVEFLVAREGLDEGRGPSHAERSETPSEGRPGG